MNEITKRQTSNGKAKRHLRAEVDEVLSCLQPLDLNILRWLLRYPFSRVEDVTRALMRVENPTRKHGRDKPLHDSTVYRHLKFHQDLDLVESVIAPGLGSRSSALYHLSNLGLHVLAANMHPPRSAAALAHKCHTDEQGLITLLPRLASLVTLQTLINGIDTLAPTRLSFRGKTSRVWWSNVRDYRHPFHYRDRSYVVAADAAVILQVRPPRVEGVQAPDLWYSLFILLDTGLHSVDLITNRLRTLLYYRECPERWGGDQSYYAEFPPILVLTTTRHRQEHWQRLALQINEGTRFAPIEGGIISQEEIHDGENIQRFPWSLGWKTFSIGDRQGRPLHDLLHPIPPEAIPSGMILPHEWQNLDLEESLPVSTAKVAERPLPQVIQGNFTQRAKQITTRSIQPGKSSHTRTALLGLALTSRQHELLQFMFDCPMVSTTDIAALLDMKPSSAERYIRDLRGSGYLDLIDTQRYQQEIHTWAPENIREHLIVKADIGKRWQLSEQGLRVLAASLHVNVRAIAIEKNEALQKRGRIGDAVPATQGEIATRDTPSPLLQRASIGMFALRRVEHQSGIYSFFAQLNQATHEENTRLRHLGSSHQYALLWWEMGIFNERRYHHLDKMHNLRPDAAAEYQYQEKAKHPRRFWLEWDRNTMGTSDLQEKFDTYLYYLGSKAYQVRDQKSIPWLLIVVPSPDQERRVSRIAAEKFAHIDGVYLRITTITRLEDKGALAEIWLPVLPSASSGPGNMQRYRFFEGTSR